MRIAVGRLAQEVNALSPVQTTLADFQAHGIFFGEDALAQVWERNELAGFLEAARAAGDVELVPTLSTWTVPAGKIESSAYRFLKESLVARIREAGDLDGILLSLHGAMVAEGVYDPEGDLLATIRAELGDRIPISVSLDHHANLTRKMVENASFLRGYHTEPHVDAFETGYAAASALFAIIRGTTKPTLRYRKLPMIAAGNLLVPAGPLGPFFAEAEAMEKLQGVLSVSIFPEFFYADTPELGWSVVAITDDAPDLAQSLCDRLAKGLWESRWKFLPESWPGPAEAVAQALATEGGPVVLADFGDMTTGGAPGDGTALLRELLSRDSKERAMLTVVDPDAVGQSIMAGVGQEITLTIGGKIDTVHNRPVVVTGRVKAITDGRYISSIGQTLTPIDMGRTVVLEVGAVYVVLCTRAGPNLDPALYRSVGLEPREAKIVVVKSAYSFRAGYEAIAKNIVMVNSPGVSSPDLRAMRDSFTQAPRPLFPLDDNVSLAF